jgi:DNA-directed RNA polymerases I, II, and III subunit RPABC2
MSDTDEQSVQSGDESDTSLVASVADTLEKVQADTEEASDTDDDEPEVDKLIRDIRVESVFDQPDLGMDSAPSQSESELSGSDDMSGEDTDDEDDDVFDRLTDALREKTLREYHPSLHTGTDQYALARTCIKRNTDGVIEDKQHRTLPRLSKYERTRVIGMRAAQIAHGSAPLVPPDGISIAFELACKELNARLLPFIIKRPLPNGECEYWKIADLEY